MAPGLRPGSPAQASAIRARGAFKAAGRDADAGEGKRQPLLVADLAGGATHA